jgi:recombination protein RecA
MSTPLSQALATLRRRYGDAVIQSGDTLSRAAAVWPTGLPTLDSRLTAGGLPLGRLSLLAAPTSPGASGRLTLLQALSAAASRERTVVYLDLAGSLDPGFLADLGADLEALLVVRPPSGRWGEGLSMARSLVVAGAPWLAVALPPGAPGGSRGDPGWEHRLVGLVEAVSARQAVCLVAAAAPVPPALSYAASLALGCEAAGWQEAHGDVVGLRTRLTVLASKVGAPGETASLLLRYPRPFATAGVVGRPAVVDLSATAETVRAQVPAAAAG